MATVKCASELKTGDRVQLDGDGEVMEVVGIHHPTSPFDSARVQFKPSYVWYFNRGNDKSDTYRWHVVDSHPAHRTASQMTPDELRALDMPPDTAAAQWLARYQRVMVDDPDNDIGTIADIAQDAAPIIRAQQAELRDVNEHLAQAVAQRHAALLEAERLQRQLDTLKSKPALENGEERIWIDGVPHIVVNGEWVRDEDMWRDMNDKPKE